MKLQRMAAMPFHLAQVATGAKSFEKNAVLGSRRLNELGLHRARVRAAMRLAERRRRSLAHGVDAEAIEGYRRNGFVQITDFLAPETFAQVTREIETGTFDRYDMLQGQTVTRRALIDDRDLRLKPGLRAARDDPRMSRLIRYVASHRGEPLLTLQVVMARGAGEAGSADPQTMLHSDTFQPTAKAWLFLRDVGPEDGPFQYVPGSHLMTPERLEWEHAIACRAGDIENRYAARGSLRVAADDLVNLGYGAPRAMTVRANTLVVADTHGFHARSPSPGDTTRIEIYGSLRRNPFLPVALPSPTSLPGLKGRTNRLVIDGLAALARAGLRGTPWTSVGEGRADEWSPLL